LASDQALPRGTLGSTHFRFVDRAAQVYADSLLVIEADMPAEKASLNGWHGISNWIRG